MLAMAGVASAENPAGSDIEVPAIVTEPDPTVATDNTLDVANHVAPLRGVDVERRGVPALRLEDRPEQERLPSHLDAGAMRIGPADPVAENGGKP